MHPRHALGSSLHSTGGKARTFEELPTHCHHMELSIANRETKGFLVPKVKKEKREIKGTEKITKSATKESIDVNTTPLKFSPKGKEEKVGRKDDGGERRCLTLKEKQEKVYLFLDSEVANMLEQLLEKQLLQLLECKQPE